MIKEDLTAHEPDTIERRQRKRAEKVKGMYESETAKETLKQPGKFFFSIFETSHKQETHSLGVKRNLVNTQLFGPEKADIWYITYTPNKVSNRAFTPVHVISGTESISVSENVITRCSNTVHRFSKK